MSRQISLSYPIFSGTPGEIGETEKQFDDIVDIASTGQSAAILRDSRYISLIAEIGYDAITSVHPSLTP
jgi:hypothetical protein